MEIHNLFPTAIGNSIRYLTNEEKYFFDKLREEPTTQNAGNTFTKDRYILNRPELKNLKIDLTDIVNNYLQKLIQPAFHVKPYITISWVNYTEEGQWHHDHCHPNSVFSGVYYIDTDETDKITFTNPNILPYTLDIHPNEYNHWNSKTWWLSTPKDNVFIFPSSLVHKVEATTNKNTRVSLSFNTFLKGQIHEKLSELNL